MHFRKFLRNISSDEYELLYLSEDSLIGKYEKIGKKRFISLSCKEIQGILSKPSRYFSHPHPMITIELVSSNRDTIIIKPYTYYEGCAWIIYNNTSTSYISYKYAMKFIENIGFEKFLLFYERDYLLLHIAEFLHNN